MKYRVWGKKLLTFGLTAVLTLSAAGCGGQDNTEKADNTADTGSAAVSEEGSISEEAPVEDALSLPTAFLSDTDMELADMWADCDDRALAAVMRKAEMGEKVTIASIGGTDSYLGVHRLERDVLYSLPFCLPDLSCISARCVPVCLFFSDGEDSAQADAAGG